MVLGRIRDALWARLWRGGGGGGGKKALAPLVDPHAAFYARRIYGRIHVRARACACSLASLVACLLGLSWCTRVLK
jgi:hypothetical protein